MDLEYELLSFFTENKKKKSHFYKSSLFQKVTSINIYQFT